MKDMAKVYDIRIEDFNYPLPDERIAKHPLAQRDECKLLLYKGGECSEHVFREIPELLPADSTLVYNNTRVINARLRFRKPGGGALIEIFCLEPLTPADYALSFASTDGCEWLCFVGNSKRWKEGKLALELTVDGKPVTLYAERDGQSGNAFRIRFSWSDGSVTFASILDAVGEIPIPPYLNRKTEESDKTTYQTVYSKIKGSVAAPTAGLHFTDAVLQDLDAHGIDREEVTLHVGAGTFKPVKSLEIEGHQMHTEYIVVHRRSLEKLIKHECQVIAVGTTSVRTIESLYYMGVHLIKHPEASEEDLHVNQWDPYELSADGNLVDDITPVQAIQAIVDYLDRNGLEALHSSTQIIIAPGYTYKIVKMLVTNFHQPQSTLLLLVSAFLHGDWKKVYDYALAHDFRFLSYGDSSLLIP